MNPGGWVEHALCLLALMMACALGWRMKRQSRLQAGERWRERRVREELETYARMDLAMVPAFGMVVQGAAAQDAVEAARMLSKRVCRVVAEKSAFSRVAMLLRDAEGRLYCAGSVGVDDLTVKALQAWGVKVMEEERSGGRHGAKSFAIPLGEWSRFDQEVSAWAMSGRKERRRWRRGIVAPVRTGTGRMLGALAVCADGINGGARGIDQAGGWPLGLEKAMGPIEALAARIATSLENEALSERLLRAEKLAGLGQLAGGVAHALNNPLTAVLGFAELIAETSSEARVRKDAETIKGEALKMRDTVQRLTEFWRPGALADEPVAVMGILGELGAACRSVLELRGVRLVVTAGDAVPLVRGSRDRLKQVMEHLLNNSAQAIAAVGVRNEEGDEGHAIRITVTHDDRMLHVIVSDTGPGFKEPGRVFDPFYTTKAPELGAGLGLSICYGIVREHGGEISAFNLHPHGAAVVVELPVERVVAAEPGVDFEHGLCTTEEARAGG